MHGTYNRCHGSWNVFQKNFEPTSHNLIGIIKNWNYLTLNFVMSDSEIAPKEDDAKIASDDKYVEGGKTQMGKISQNIFI